MKQLEPQEKSMNLLGQTVIDLTRGLLVAVLVFVVTYAISVAYILGRNQFYKSKWERNGSNHYRATIELNGMLPYAGTITVENGKVIAVTQDDIIVGYDLSFFDGLTIEEAFAAAGYCAKHFPVVSCTLEYDKNLGYPKHVVTSCHALDCWSELSIVDVKLLEP